MGPGGVEPGKRLLYLAETGVTGLEKTWGTATPPHLRDQEVGVQQPSAPSPASHAGAPVQGKTRPFCHSPHWSRSAWTTAG